MPKQPTMTERLAAAERERDELRAERDSRVGLSEKSGALSNLLSRKWWPTVASRMIGPAVVGVIVGGTVVLISNDEGEKNSKGEIVTAADKAQNDFMSLIEHLPTIGMIILISLLADYIAKWVMSQSWFDRHGSAQELDTIRSRIGTAKEKAQDGAAAGLGFIGNRLFAAAVALALLLHFS